MINICITGHRKLLYPDTVREQIRSSLQYFQACYKNKEDVVAVTAMASGTDTIFAEEALYLGIAVKAIFPFAANEYEKDFSPEEWQRVHAVINNKKRPVQLEIANTLNSFAEEEKKNAYLNTGVQLVDEANIVLAVWDGLAPQGAGGTADIVRYAISKNKELHTIKGLRQAKEGILPVHDELQATYQKQNKNAIRYKWWFVFTWRSGIIAGVMAALFFSFGLALKLDDPAGWHKSKYILAVCEIASLGISLLLLLVVARRLKNIFLDNRHKAEYLRSVIWFSEAGIPVQPADPHPFSADDPILKIIKDTLAAITSIANFPHAKRMTWCLATMQSEYHQHKRIRPFKHKSKLVEYCLLILKYLFFAIVLVNFWFEWYEHKHHHLTEQMANIHPWLIFAWMFPPPVYAALEGVKYFTEWKMQITKSEKIKKELDKVSEKVMTCSDVAGLSTEAKNLRTIMELEITDWAEWYWEKEIAGHI